MNTEIKVIVTDDADEVLIMPKREEVTVNLEGVEGASVVYLTVGRGVAFLEVFLNLLEGSVCLAREADADDWAGVFSFHCFGRGMSLGSSRDAICPGGLDIFVHVESDMVLTDSAASAVIRSITEIGTL